MFFESMMGPVLLPKASASREFGGGMRVGMGAEHVGHRCVKADVPLAWHGADQDGLPGTTGANGCGDFRKPLELSLARLVVEVGGSGVASLSGSPAFRTSATVPTADAS